MPIAGLLALIPVLSAFFYGVVGQDKFLLLSPLVVVGYALLAFGLANACFSRNAAPVAPPSLAFWLLFTAFGVGLVYMCPIPYEARLRMLVVGLCVGAFLIWGNALVLFRSSRTVLAWLLVFSLLISFYGLVNFFKQPDMVLWVERYAPYEGRLASTYICPNHFAHWLQMLLPFCLVLLFIPQAGIFLRILAGYSILVFVPVITLTESRAGMLGAMAAVGITILLVALRKNKKLFILLLVAVPLASGILLVGAWNTSEMFRRRMEPVVQFVGQLKTEGFANPKINDFRPLTWLDSMDMVADKPVSGHGPGSFRYTYPEYRQRFKGTRVVTGHPHNEYLELAAEYGWVGFVLFALAWCWGLVRILIFSLKTPNQHHAFMAMAFLGTAAGTMVHSFFDFQMHVFQNALLFCLLAGIAVGPMCGRKQERLAGNYSFVRRLAMVLLLLVSIAGLGIAAKTHASAFLRAKADRQLEADDKAAAATSYQRAIRIDASNWRAYKGLGQLIAFDRWHSLDMAEKKTLAESEIAALEHGYEANPMDAELLLALGRAVIFAGDVDRGLGHLREATVRRPFNDNVWWRYGVELRKAGRYEEALAVFQRAASIKRTPSIRKNIQWLERRRSGETTTVQEGLPATPAGTLKKDEGPISLDDLHNLLDAQ